MPYSHASSDLQIWPWLAWKPGLDCGLYCNNFGFLNGDRRLAHSDDEANPGDYKNWAPIQWVEAAKDIPREKRAFDFLKPVRPPAPASIKRQKRFKAHTGQVSCDDILVP